MGIRSLRYPGGEEANSFEWAPPPYGPNTTPQPILTTTYGFPGGDWLFYDRYNQRFQVQEPASRFHALVALLSIKGACDGFSVLHPCESKWV
jgi:hypothetical protein